MHYATAGVSLHGVGNPRIMVISQPSPDRGAVDDKVPKMEREREGGGLKNRSWKIGIKWPPRPRTIMGSKVHGTRPLSLDYGVGGREGMDRTVERMSSKMPGL